MKNILITGENGYIGNQFSKWVLTNFPNQISVEFLSVRNDEWRTKDFSMYDSVLHLAGIAHSSRHASNKDLYYRINRDLTFEVATYAKKYGVKQFIFMSSIIVYGDADSRETIIDKHTVPNPATFYGDSKLQAESLLNTLKSNEFKVAVIRPPMIYGEGSKGNYSRLSRLASITPVFPHFINKRSMLFVDNLSMFLYQIIENQSEGLFFPQNNSYVNTSEMVQVIAKSKNRKMHLIPGFQLFIKLMIKRFEVANKLFGTFIYDQELSRLNGNTDYCIYDFHESIFITEGIKYEKK
ncbi:NAD-dependent epimerase/dehydratase family protein [Exiguobacterium acetylicum]|uniref:NAD-dependent epimerase/dehydratase family protein n=1 Tax=Exiguobacterium acetylicum TaxID=41170 RepID=UPI002DBBEC1E|nr:NAD-dependent epimerase/dehydratase family protein [Exiguobacterium indicum]